mmetsp:Transcript_6920/g.5166  ORF Transcript_6920/g.5166 Transcript_6920/m.5166 type:complete len:223 (-) Transcript_6920:562-1230(-)
MTFFNTALLLLLANANFSEAKIPFLKDYLRGKYTDFHAGWFVEVGETLVKTMIINAFMPLVEFGIGWGMSTFFRMMDRSFGSDTYKSKCKSVQQYVERYSGPVYQIHFRYSTILNTVFVTCMYGTAIPILYPVALLSFTILYLMERLLVFYYYKQPPAYDQQMTYTALNILRWAPFLMFAMGYWVLGNNQVFDNKVFVYEYTTNITLSGHTIATDMAHFKFD